MQILDVLADDLDLDPADLDALDFNAILSRGGPTLLDIRIDGEEVPPMNLRMKTLGTSK